MDPWPTHSSGDIGWEDDGEQEGMQRWPVGRTVCRGGLREKQQRQPDVLWVTE